MQEKTSLIEQRIMDFVKKKSHAEENRVNPKTMLFLEGIFDSMGFILLIDFLENTFDIRANEDELTESNFESIEAITAFVHRKVNGSSSWS